jgi:uncharacterized protein GlcG (DUF336 family)
MPGRASVVIAGPPLPGYARARNCCQTGRRFLVFNLARHGWRGTRFLLSSCRDRSIDTQTFREDIMSRVSSTAVAIALGATIAAAASTANAQGVINQPRLSANLANQVVGDTVAICAQRKYNVWAVIVDLDGVRIAVLRGNGAPIHSQDNAYYKAYAAASLTLGRNEGSTYEIAQRMAKAPPSNVPNTQLPNVTYARGGMAIRAGDGRIIGGLGVSGAPGGNFDEECGNAALDKIKDQLK